MDKLVYPDCFVNVVLILITSVGVSLAQIAIYEVGDTPQRCENLTFGALEDSEGRVV